MSKLHLLVVWSVTGHNFAQNSVCFSVSSTSSIKGKSEQDENISSADLGVTKIIRLHPRRIYYNLRAEGRGGAN